eukprot:3193403-Pyramimonas_sp.AAC.1
MLFWDCWAGRLRSDIVARDLLLCGMVEECVRDREVMGAAQLEQRRPIGRRIMLRGRVAEYVLPQVRGLPGEAPVQPRTEIAQHRCPLPARCTR